MAKKKKKKLVKATLRISASLSKLLLTEVASSIVLLSCRFSPQPFRMLREAAEKNVDYFFSPNTHESPLQRLLKGEEALESKEVLVSDPQSAQNSDTEALKGVIAHQVKAIQQLHLLLENAESYLVEMAKYMRLNSNRNGEDSQSKRNVSISTSEAVIKEENYTEPLPLRVRQSLNHLYDKASSSDRSHLECITAFMIETVKANSLSRSEIQRERRARLKIDEEWTEKFSDMVDRMNVLEKLVNRSSVTDYKRGSLSSAEMNR